MAEALGLTHFGTSPRALETLRLVLSTGAPKGAIAPDLGPRLKARIRAASTPRHVPAHMLFVADLPRTRNVKLSDAAARAALNGRVVTNEDQL